MIYWFFSSQNKPYFEFQIYSKKNKADAPDGMFTPDMYECEYTYKDNPFKNLILQ